MSLRGGPSTIRIAKVVPTLLCGGTENQFMTLGRSLDPSRFTLEFACLRRVGPFVQEIEDRGIPLAEYPLPTFRSLTALVQQARFARDLARHRIDIVHTYNFYGNVFGIPPARLARVPLVIASVRDRGPYLTAWQKRVQRHVCRHADCILVNAGAVRDWLLEQGYDSRRIAVIPNGVDLGRFDSAPGREETFAGLGIPPDAPVVVVVSRLSRLKGLEQFLEAAAIVSARHRHAYFLVIGETNPAEAEYLTELRGLADRLGVGRVRFTGLRSDVPALLAHAAVSVMPSLNEALSNVLLESMAAGAPTVATRVGGTPEAVVDGVTGLLVPPDDPRALAESITRLIDDPDLAASIGREARRTIRDRFSLDRMVKATEQLYLDLLAERTKGTTRDPWRYRLPSASIGRTSDIESR